MPTLQFATRLIVSAGAGSIMAYRRREFELNALMQELLRGVPDNTAVSLAADSRSMRIRERHRFSFKMLVVHHPTITGRSALRRLFDGFGIRVQRVDSVAEADVLLVLSGWHL